MRTFNCRYTTRNLRQLKNRYNHMTIKQNNPLSPLPTPMPALLQAIEQNDSVKEDVKQSADELLIVNAVLQVAVPDQAQTGDLAVALQRTEDISDAIHESANDIAAVNQLLEDEIDERIDLERELLATKAALARAQSAATKK